MAALLSRLIKSAAAYQASSIISSLLALVTLPLYTKHMPRGDYGYSEALLTAIILSSILLRFGLGEAFVRFWFDDEDDARRRRLAHSVTGWTLILSTVAALTGLAFAGPLSRALLDHEDSVLMAAGLLGLWSFTNLEIAYALLRVQELRRVYVRFSMMNVLLSVALMVTFVVILDWGARGYVFGNYLATTIVLLSIWLHQRRYVGFRPRGLRPLFAFGAPTVPADAALFALNVVDRSYLLHAAGTTAADRYAFAAKLSTVVIVVARGFQAAWPPLAYSITDPDQARHFYARVTTAYLAFNAMAVAGIALIGPWAVRLLAGDPVYHEAKSVLPWVAAGWALYGLVQLLITVAGRVKITTRNLPATFAGLVVNVVVLVALTGPLGIVAAGIALCSAYVVMVAVLYLLTRSLFAVPFEWGRMAAALVVCGGVAAAGTLLTADVGAGAFAIRVAAGLSMPLLLVAAGVVPASELRALAARFRAGRSARPGA